MTLSISVFAFLCSSALLASTCAMERQGYAVKSLAQLSFEAIKPKKRILLLVNNPVFRSLIDQSPAISDMVRVEFLKAYISIMVQSSTHQYPVPFDNPRFLSMHADNECTVIADQTYLKVPLDDRSIVRLTLPRVDGRFACTVSTRHDGTLICAYKHQDKKRFDYCVFETNHVVRERYDNRPASPTLFSLAHNHNCALHIQMLDEIEHQPAGVEPLFYIIAPEHQIGVAVTDHSLIAYDFKHRKTSVIPHTLTSICQGSISQTGDAISIGTLYHGPVSYSLAQKKWIFFEGAQQCGVQKKELCISSSGKLLAHLNTNGKLRIWDLMSGKLLAILTGIEVMTFDPHAQRLLFIPKSYLFRQDLHLIDFGPLEKKLPASLELLMTACINGQVDLWHDHPELFESLDEQWRSFVQLLLEKKQTHCTLS